MNPRGIGVAALAAAVAFSVVAAPVAEAATDAPAQTDPPARSYTVVDLGTPGGPEPSYPHLSSARAINADGQVAGDTMTPWYSGYGFVWEAGAVETWRLGSGPRGASRVSDINASRQVVGYNHGSKSAFLWENGTTTDLGSPYVGSWGDRTVAEALNDGAQVVGSMNASGGPTRAFLWEDGNFRDLGTLGGTSAHAYDINNSGVVVGTAETASGESHAFVWEHGVMRDLGTLGGSSSSALAINDAGTIVGASMNGAGQRRAFMWDNGRMRPLPIFGHDSVAYDINSAGVVVGVRATGSRESPEHRAFVWERGRATELIAAEDTVSAAYGINDSGEVVGYGRMPERRAHAILWRPMR